MINVLVVGGSLRANSRTAALLQLVVAELENYSVHVQVLDLRHLQLPFCCGDSTYAATPDVAFMRQAFHNAHAIFLATPEYHGSLSGVLKNALDLLHEEDLKDKVIALAAVVGGLCSTNAINALRLILRHLHAHVIPQQLVIAHAERAFTSTGQLHDKMLHQRLCEMLAAFVTFAQRLTR
jgi:FMN reductase